MKKLIDKKGLLFVDDLERRLLKVISKRSEKDPIREELLKYFNTHSCRVV